MSKSFGRVAFASSFFVSAAILASNAAVAQTATATKASQPTIKLRNDGSGSVNLGNGCIVTYNYYGTRMSGTRICTPAMRAQADRIFRAGT